MTRSRLWSRALFFISTSLIPTTFSDSLQPYCYYDLGKPAEADIIPCNDGRGPVYSCCKAGSLCLHDDACWDPVTYITYLYGCTDSSYADTKCPQKCGLNTTASNWVGLMFCNGTDNTPNNTWACQHPDTCGQSCPADGHIPWDPLLEQLPSATCPDLDPIDAAFTESATIPNYALTLPTESSAISNYLRSISSLTVATAASTSFSSSSSSIIIRPGVTSSPSLSVSSCTSTTTRGPSSSSALLTPTVSSTPPSRHVALALGLGLGLGIPFLTMAFLLSLCLRQRRRKLQEPFSPKTVTANYPAIEKAKRSSTPPIDTSNWIKPELGGQPVRKEATEMEANVGQNFLDDDDVSSMGTPALRCEPYRRLLTAEELAATDTIFEMDGSEPTSPLSSPHIPTSPA